MDMLRNKFFKLFFAAALILSVTGLASAQYAGGIGSSSDPYQINTCQQLDDIGFNGDQSNHFIQTSNLDCSNLDYTIMSYQDSTNDDVQFTGSYDGQGYAIENIEFSQNRGLGSGIFGKIDGEVKNVNVIDLFFNDNENANIPGGGAVGSVLNTGSLSNIYVENATIISSQDAGVLGEDHDSSNNVQNIEVVNSSVDSGSVGGIFSTSYASGTLTNVEIRNTELSSGDRAGLIMASNYDAPSTTINEVYLENITANFNGYSASTFGDVSSELNAKDIRMNNIDINNAGASEKGLLVGEHGTFTSTIEDMVISNTNLESTSGTDGFFANNPSSITANDIYYEDSTVNVDSSKAISKTTSEITGSGVTTELSGLDFTNIWATTDSYPVLQFTLESSASLNKPNEGELFDYGDVNVSFDAQSRSDGDTFDLILQYPDGSTSNIRSETLNDGDTGTFSELVNLQTSGTYEYYVNINGETASNIRTFEVIDYSNPESNLISPVNENFQTYYSSDNTDFDFEINNALVSGDYTLQLKNGTSSTYQDVASGTFNEGNNSFTESVEVLNPNSGTQDKDWRIQTQDSLGSSTSASSSFTVERLPQPDISIEVPDNGEIFYTDSGSTVQVPFEGWVNNSQESGEAFAVSQKFGGVFDDSIGSVSTGDQYVSGDLLVNTGEFSDSKIRVDFNSGASFESNSISFEVRDGTPKIDSYNVTSDEVSNLENVEPGDFFDFTLEGSKTADDIQSIEYNVDVSGETDPSPKTITDFYQDSNIYTNSEDNLFEMQSSWAGSTLDFDVTVTDTQGRTQTDTVTVQTGTPPNEFLLNSPNIGEFFLIPEGQNEVSVDIDYGVDSSELAGDLKLFVNGNNVATQSVGSNTQQTFTYTDTYGEGTQNWYLEWTDSTGETYTSETSNFEVSQYPVGLSLDSPSEGESVQILSEPGSVDHDFTVSSDAFTGDWYYEFELTNGNGTVVGSETSTTYSGVEQQFTETVDGIEEDSYTYNVSVNDASDDSEIISKEKSYTTNFDPVFNQEIDSPGDGNIYLVEPGETRNVTYGFSVETFDDATDFTLSLDGSDVRTESVGTQTTDTFTGDFTDLGTGTYNVELSGEDASGRTNTTTVSFSVEEADSENESVEINTIEFNPNLDEARPGDELDVYIEGSGVPENVDFVEIELEVAGDTETVIVPTDELQEGSWFWNGENVATVKESWIGATAKVTGTVTDVAGRTSRFFREYIMGVNIEMSGSLETPRDGDVFLQESGEEVNIPFSGSATAGFDSINYNIQVKDQNLLGGNLGPEESADFSQFFQVSDWSLDSYGEFNAQLVLINDATNEKKTYTNTFEIVEDTGQPVVTISNPRQSQQIETPRNEDDAEVTLRYRIQTNETGTTSLVLENLDEGRQEINIDNIDSEVSESEAASGEAFRTVDITLDEATYLMRASFEDSTGQTASRERTFTVTSDPIEPEADEEVRLIDPAEGEEIAKNVGTKLRWYAIHEQDIGTPNSTFYVEDSSDTVVFNTTKDAPEVGNMNIYAEYLDANLEPGNYQFYADLELESETLETEKRNLTILDSQAPRTDLRNQDLGVFTYGENGIADIELDFSTETFGQDATIEVVTRKKGSNDKEVRFTDQQNAFRQEDYSASWQQLETGKYEYYVRMVSNPTYTSDTGTYTVESPDYEDPMIELDRPEQGETFSYNDTNASVPFRFDAEAYTLGDTNFTLLLETVSEDNSELESIDSFTLNNESELLEYNESFDLEESGYRYQVVAEYDGETWSSDTRSFVVDDEATEGTPQTPSTEEGFGILSRISDFGERLLGDNSDFILGFGLLLITSVGITVRTRSDKIGLATMIAMALGLSYVGIFPSWIAAVLTFLSVGVAIFITGRVMGGAT